MEQKQFSRDFKDAVIAKIVGREGQTIADVCRQAGVAKSTGSRWVYERAIASGMKKSKSSGHRSAEEKFRFMVQSEGLGEEDLGLFLRKEGLHSHQLKEWRAEVLAALAHPRKVVRDGSAPRIRELERDLNRKDKALAEASALLILQKKVNLIWGNKNEDEK
jgi:transposase